MVQLLAGDYISFERRGSLSTIGRLHNKCIGSTRLMYRWIMKGVAQ
jgi:hypothetical protein